jgi:PAS domain S-box-containing protein
MIIDEPDPVVTDEVLVVEDSKDSLQLLIDILSRGGYKVRPATTGELALRSLKAKRPDIVLLDIKMPGMDGFEVCRQLKANRETRTIPVIFISALDDGHSKIRGFEIGAVDYINKPFHAEEVLARVKTHLTIAHLQVDLERQNAHLLNEIAVRRQAEQSLENLNTELESRIQKRTALLAESEAQLNAIFNLSPIGKSLVTMDGHFLKVNAVFCGILGYSAEALLNKTIQDILYPDDLELDRDYQNQLLAANLATYEIQKRCVRASGRVIWTQQNVSLIRDGDGLPIRFIFQIQDITVRRLDEALLQESVDRLSEIIDHTSAGYFFVDHSGRFQRVNRAWLTMHGYLSADEVIGKHFSMTQVETDMEKSNRNVALLLAGKSIPTGEATRRCRDGSIGYHSFSAHPVIHAGQVIGLEGFIIDLTAQKQAEEKKAELEAQNRLLQKAESLRTMAGAIAHNFNNQLQVVTGSLEIAMDDLPPDSDVRDMLTEALKGSHRAAEISRLMLTYLGQPSGNHEPLDLSRTCQMGLFGLGDDVSDRVMVSSEFPSSGATIRGSAPQIQQMMTNLIINAQESIGDNPGTIRVAIKTVLPGDIPESHRFPINWRPVDGLYACLEIADTGCGIPVMDMDKLFDPFFTTKFTGRGLGLPVVIGIVRAHGGGITVESCLGKGSVFRIFFPVTDVEIPATLKKETRDRKIETVGTVLIAEDEEQIRSMLKAMLKRLGFTVLEAGDGMKAVEIFRQHPDEICCVLSDLTMPGMNGWETIAALRKISPDLPVILSSGYDESRVMAEAHSERPNAFLGKPYQLKLLGDTLRRVLGETGAEGKKEG